MDTPLAAQPLIISGKAMKPRILLVDDHEIVRKGVRGLLELPALEVCGEASNGQEALEKILALKPDLVLMDLSMPVMGGAEAMKQIRKVAPDIKIIILTAADELADTSGADACVSKRSVVSDLYETIKGVLLNRLPIWEKKSPELLAVVDAMKESDSDHEWRAQDHV